MSNSNTNRTLSVTRNQYDGQSVEDVDIDFVYKQKDIHLTLSFGATRDYSTLKSKESLMRELEDAWSAFLKVMQQEGLILDSFSKEITGVPVNTLNVIPTGHPVTDVNIILGNRSLEIG